MNIRIRAALLGTLSLIVGTLFAEEPTATPTIPPKIERVVGADSLIGSELKSETHHLGVVSDYVIDLATGHIALILVVNNDTPVDIPERMALAPSNLSFDGTYWRLADNVSDEQLATAKRISHEAADRISHRKAIRELYLALGCELYWNTAAERQEPLGDELSLWSELRQTKLVDSDGTVAGGLEDLGIAPNTGQIAYAAIDVGQSATAGNVLYAIPLSALVVPNLKKPWQIELALGELQSMETFPRDKWPTEVSRGWVEYVHVRYGNSALSGVQSKVKAESPREE